MKFLLILVVILFIPFYAAAQPTGGAEDAAGTFAEFDTLFFFNFDIAEADCPGGYVAGTCYVHGYNDFFAFKREFALVFALDLETVKRWRLTTLNIAGETEEVFSATYRLRQGDDTFTLIYLPENRLFLER